jgi:hypothetical protein
MAPIHQKMQKNTLHINTNELAGNVYESVKTSFVILLLSYHLKTSLQPLIKSNSLF